MYCSCWYLISFLCCLKWHCFFPWTFHLFIFSLVKNFCFPFPFSILQFCYKFGAETFQDFLFFGQPKLHSLNLMIFKISSCLVKHLLSFNINKMQLFLFLFSFFFSMKQHVRRKYSFLVFRVSAPMLVKYQWVKFICILIK